MVAPDLPPFSPTSPYPSVLAISVLPMRLLTAILPPAGQTSEYTAITEQELFRHARVHACASKQARRAKPARQPTSQTRSAGCNCSATTTAH